MTSLYDIEKRLDAINTTLIRMCRLKEAELMLKYNKEPFEIQGYIDEITTHHIKKAEEEFQ